MTALTLPVVTSPVERLLHRLDLHAGPDHDDHHDWYGEAGENALNMSNRLFGGMVVGQTIVAAGRTHPDRRVHSVQQVFLHGGNAVDPLTYRVHRIFTGRTYASVRVEVHQSGHVISHAQVGVTGSVPGPDRQDSPPARPPRRSSVNRDELRGRPNWADQPVEMLADPDLHADDRPDLALWMRPAGPMPHDELLHQGVIGFVSDRALMSVAWRPHAGEHDMRGATLDHSLWFHRPVRFDDWHTHVMHSPTLAGGRGLSHGVIHHHDGTHVATTMQQGTFRIVDPSRA